MGVGSRWCSIAATATVLPVHPSHTRDSALRRMPHPHGKTRSLHHHHHHHHHHLHPPLPLRLRLLPTHPPTHGSPFAYRSLPPPSRGIVPARLATCSERAHGWLPGPGHRCRRGHCTTIVKLHGSGEHRSFRWLPRPMASPADFCCQCVASPAPAGPSTASPYPAAMVGLLLPPVCVR